MFGLGAGELIVIAVVIVVCTRPRDFPRILRRLGRIFGRLQGSCDPGRPRGEDAPPPANPMQGEP